MPFNLQVVGGGGLEQEEEEEEEEEEEAAAADFWRKGLLFLQEPTSVLDKRSTSPTTSSTTLSSPHLGPTASSSTGDVGPAICLDNPWEDPTPTPTTAPAMLPLVDPSAPAQDHAFLHWMMGDDPDNPPNIISSAATTTTSSFGLVEPCFALEPTIFPPPPGPPALPAFFQEPLHLQNPPPFLLSLPQFEPHLLPFPQSPTFPPPPAPLKPKTPAPTDEFVSGLFRAAELVQSGDPVTARGILARLNQQLPSPIGKPLLRSAFYFKEALLLLATNTPPAPPLATPFDVLLKLGTYKAFSDLSPILQFTNFTSIQALLEDLHSSDRIHIVDFDLGVGGHWSSFIQELAHRRRPGSPSPSLKITAFASHSSHHPLELHLTRDNLSHFAADLDLPFEFNVLSLDSFDALPLAPDEAVAVNLPIGSGLDCCHPLPAVLRLVKQLNPRIVVSVDHGCDRSDLAFSQHLLHALQSCAALLDSIDASGASPDVANKIERYLVQPRIENAVLARGHAGEKAPHWRTAFAAAGFVPVQFSNFTETQAEYVLKRVQVRGFQVEKRQASLCLCWQRGELVSVSAWRC